MSFDVLMSLKLRTVNLLLSLPPFPKRLLVVFVDCCLCVLTTWVTFYLRLGEFIILNSSFGLAALLSIGLAIPIFSLMRLYKPIFRYAGWYTIFDVGIAMTVYSLGYVTIVTAIGLEGIPRTVGFIQPLLLFFGVACTRMASRFLLGDTYRNWLAGKHLEKVLIYGAGSAGRQLAGALSVGNDMLAVGYVDDDDRLHGQILNGLPIFDTEDLEGLIDKKNISYVLLAMPSISRLKRNAIMARLSEYRVIVRTLPSVSSIVDGRVSVSDLKDPDIHDLLGRDIVPPNQVLLSKAVEGRVVLVTGAGGSVGGELCRQIIGVRPKVLLLVEMNEFALYSIHAELESIRNSDLFLKDVRLIPLLGSVQDGDRMREIMSAWAVSMVYHAAAYKHVPLVEQNVLEGLKNNLFGSLETAHAAIDSGVSDFILISTDKAVRPTSVMGATKRLAELCLQALGSWNHSKTRFSMVRFGNVLSSSGSVIPKFRAQISGGGPITVTHPDITRYFMTIPEAAQLVIQAGALAKGGEIFLLDMGDPVKIIDLAKQMIRLSGLVEKTSNRPDGDIEIQFVGLRPGEKLFEELLIDDNAVKTIHPKIMKASEENMSWVELESKVEIFRRIVTENDAETAIETLKQLVHGFVPSARLEDSTSSSQ